MQNEEVPTVRVSVEVEAAPDDVWQAITTDDGLAGWLGEDSTIGSAPGEELYAADMVTGESKRGYIDEFETDRHLGYTWWPEDSPQQATRVDITLEPFETGTRVTVVETAPALSGGRTMWAQAQAAGGDWTWRASMLVVLAPTMAVTTHVAARHR